VIAVVFALAVSAAGPANNANATIGDGTPIFTRDEPHLAAGRRALSGGDADVAIERFRAAVAENDDERAIVEYDVGAALVARAVKDAEDAAKDAPAPDPAAPGPPGPPAPPPAPNVDDALTTFERASDLARHPRLKSEARLAAGTAALMGQKIDDAIAQFRKSLVADPGNERARRNLQRALMLKAAQPPPPPQEGDGDGEKKDGDPSEQKDGDPSDQKNGEQNDGDKSNADDKDQQGPDKGDADTDDKKDGDDKDGDDKDDKEGDQAKDNDKDAQKDPQSAGDKNDDDEGEKGKDGSAPAAPKKPTSKEEARRILEGIRSRERPLSPLEMRGTEKAPAAPGGKEW
jgi:tetratricopeptide (TPR) repeat protein